MTAAERSKRRTRFFRFSLRQLFVLFFAVAALLSVFVPGWQRQWREHQQAEASRRLLAAAAEGDVDGAARALAAGADLRACDSRGYTAMAYAVERRDLSILELLLASGADVNCDWWVGRTPLYIAVNANDRIVARRLLDAGADPNWPSGPGGPHGRSPLHWCVEKGYLEMMTLLLDFGADIEQDGRLALDCDPPLFMAARCNQPIAVRFQMIKLLVERGANPRRALGYSDTMPPHFFLKKIYLPERPGQAEIPHFNLMDSAVAISDPQLGDFLRQYGLPYGPREMAAFNRLDELKQAILANPGLLRERVEPATIDCQGQPPTLLGIAVERGYREMAQFLIESGAPVDAIQSPTVYGEATPLFFASRRGDPEMIRMLAAHGADVNARDECRNTPLTDCAGHADPETVRALLAVGANVNALGIYNLTALHQAAKSHRTETVRILLAAGADPIIRDQQGQTALDYATARRPSDSELVNLLNQAVSGRHSIGHAGRGGKAGIAKPPP